MNIPSVDGEDLSMAFWELYPIVVAAVLWGKEWTCRRIMFMFMCDNSATVCILHKGISKCLAIMKLMRTLTWTAAVNSFYYRLSSKIVSEYDQEIPYQVASTANKEPDVCPAPELIIWDYKT